MKHNAKRILGIILTLLMCVSMLTCIILPVSAATTEDTTPTDPYAATNAHATVATVSDGKITVNGTEVAVPDKFKDDTILIPDGRMYFYDPDWTAAGLGIAGNEGDVFFAQYGDGTTWGNGKVYALTWRVNAFGATQYTDVTDISGKAISGAGAGTFDGWADLTEILRHKVPTVGGDNNYYVMLAPGLMTDNTAPNGASEAIQYAVADVTSDAAVAAGKTTVAELEQSDYTNVHFFGPQAGRSPSAGKVGNPTLCNGRSVDTDREIVFISDFRLPTEAVYHVDGIALGGVNGQNKTRIYMPSYTSAEHVSGLYMTNMYFEVAHTSAVWCLLGSGSNISKAATVLHITDSYFNATAANTTTSVNYQAASDILYENVVFNMNMQKSASGDPNGKLRLTPVDYNDTAFLGELRGDARFELSECTFVGQYGQTLSTYNYHFNNCTDGAEFYIHDSHFEGLTRLLVETYAYNPSADSSSTSDKKYAAALGFKKSTSSVVLTVEDNYIATIDDADALYKSTYFFTLPAKGHTITNNTFVADVDGGVTHYDFQDTVTATDVSGNLFLDHDGNVRPSTNEDNRDAVDSDIYASDEFSGGIRELFTVQETTQDLLVTNSSVVVAQKDIADHFTGSVTILPKDGVTYNTEKIFTYKDENVKLLGFYKDEACTQLVSSFTKGFGTLYAKAQYKAGNTTATVLYTITEPTAYHVVDLSSEATTYGFNGTTYVSGENATFYTTIADAVAKAAATDVVLLMPGTYPTEDVTIENSVAIVGPKAFTSASDGKSNAIANSRSYTDASGEAILTAMLGFANTKASYVTVAGVAMSSSDKTFVAYTGSGAGNTTNYANQRVSFLNITNVCVSAKTILYVGHRVGTSKWSTSPQYDTHVNVYGSYFATEQSSSFNITANYFTIQKSAVVGTLASAKTTQALLYMTPVDPARLGCKPAGSALRIENCYLSKGVTKANYLLGYRTRYWSDSKECEDDVTRDLKNHAKVILNNNTVYNETAGDHFARLMIAGANCCTVEATGNYVEYTSSSSGEFLEYNSTGYVDSDPAMDVTFSDNAFINCKVPVILPGNNVNLDKNYYGTSAGAVQLVTAGTDYGAVKDQNTYYLDAKMTTKNTDVQLVDDGYTAFETTFDGINNTTITSAKDLSVADLKTVEGATVLGVYSDAAMTTAVTGAFDEDGTYYVNIQKTSTSVAWPTKLTLDVPCKHLEGTADKTKRVAGDKKEPTCGTDGYQKYSCSECGNTVDAWEVSIDATGAHNWALDNTHADYVAPTCTTPGTNVYVCQNTDCAETPKTRTETAPTVEHTKGEAMEVFADSTCMAIGLKAYKCKWFDECGKWMISTDAMNAYIGGDTATLSAYTEGVDYEIIEKQTHDFDESNWSKDESGHWHACIAARECTAQGDFAGHTDSDVIAYEGKEATCGVDGLGYIECTVCGYVVDDAAVIPATGEHNFDNDCDATCDGCTLVRDTGHTYDNSCDTECNVCFEVRVITHTFDYPCDSYCNVCGYGRTVAHASVEWKTVTAATIVKDGLETLNCTICGKEITSRVISKLATTDVKNVFTDIKSTDWFYTNNAVSYVYNAGLIKGVTETTFSPNGTMTRGMFVTVLGRLYGVDQNSIEHKNIFTDVANGKYYSKYVVWASEAGIVNGVTATQFAPDGKITREQLCTMMVRYCDYADIELKEIKAAVTFSDAASISAYAKTAVAACQKAGLVQGKGGNKFDPKGTATRAEVSTILMNFYTNCMH